MKTRYTKFNTLALISLARDLPELTPAEVEEVFDICTRQSRKAERLVNLAKAGWSEEVWANAAGKLSYATFKALSHYAIPGLMTSVERAKPALTLYYDKPCPLPPTLPKPTARSAKLRRTR